MSVVSRWGLNPAHATALTVFFSGPAAHAYCLTTTCNPDVSCAVAPANCCKYDAQLCDTNGEVVNWPQSCVSYSSQQDGSARLGITQPDLAHVLEQAYDQWLNAPCKNGQPISLSVEDRGAASCDVPEFNSDPKQSNANVWMFQDDPEKTNNLTKDGLGIDASSLAVSVITINPITAELVNVDVEFNSAAADFTLDVPRGDEVDLLAVATHEAGHFLGIEHSIDTSSTMYAYYHYDQRTLSADDQDAICAAYPADRTIEARDRTCEPYGGYSPDCAEPKGCGCRAAGAADRGTSWVWLGAAATGAWFLRRRRTCTTTSASGARPGFVRSRR